MKFKNIALSILMIALGLTAQAQTNLIPKGDFETITDLDSLVNDGWIGGQTNQALEIIDVINGTKSVRFTGVSTASYISRDIDVEAGDTCTLTFTGRIHAAGGPSGSAATADGLLIGRFRAGTSSGDWTSLMETQSNTDTTMTGSYVVPSGLSQIRLQIYKTKAIAYIDDVSLVITKPVVEDPKLVCNGDFEVASLGELASAGWLGTGTNMALEANAANVINGAKSIRMTGNSASAFLSYNVDVESGVNYSISFIGRIGDGAGASGTRTVINDGFLRMRFNTPDGSGGWVNGSNVIETQSVSDITLDAMYTVPVGVTQIQLQIFKNKGIAYVDDVTLVKNVATSVKNIEKGTLKAYSTYPGSLTVKAEQSIKTLSLYSIDGKHICNITANSNEMAINELKSGIYILRAQVENENHITLKVIVK